MSYIVWKFFFPSLYFSLYAELLMLFLEVKVAQLCLTLCDPTDYTVHGILHARILEWVAGPFSRTSSQSRDWTQVSCIAGGVFYQLSHKGRVG